MRLPHRLWIAILLCLALAIGAYFWATGMLDSVFAYRSPLHAQPPAPGEPLGTPLTRRVVMVLIDALRADTSQKQEVMPTLNELRQQGAWATMHSRPPSYSEPGYTVLLTGAWPDLSDGPTINLDYAEIPTWTQDNLFSAAHRAGLKTAISGYYWFEKLVPQEAVSAHFYTPGEDQAADRQVVDAALPWLADSSYALVLVHIDQVDYAGHHEGGPRSPNWDAAARRADDLLREIAAPLDLQKDTLLVFSDHGQIDRGGHGGQDPITLVEPFVMVGAGVHPGQLPDVQMVDVAPTVAALLGTNLPASSQGNVLTGALGLAPNELASMQAAVRAQQSALLQAYGDALGLNTNPVTGEDAVNASQSALEALRGTRLQAGRLPRFLIAGLLALAMGAAGLWALRRSRDLPWLALGAALYLLVFNLKYAVLDGRTYSLSSVAGSTELITYCAVTAAIALLLAWLAASLGARAFRRAPSQAAAFTLALALFILYLLALPALWSFALNGLVVTWTLPDFASMFLGFLSLIQLLLVAVLGIVLCGVAALIARIRMYGLNLEPPFSKPHLR